LKSIPGERGEKGRRYSFSLSLVEEKQRKGKVDCKFIGAKFKKKRCEDRGGVFGSKGHPRGENSPSNNGSSKCFPRENQRKKRGSLKRLRKRFPFRNLMSLGTPGSKRGGGHN